jgi:polyphosphate kinase 2 (PPK2 family)
MSRPLDRVDLTLTMSKEESLTRVEAAQKRLLHLRLFTAGLVDRETPGPGLVVLFEGFDAAGKGGSIHRITTPLDPRHVRVVPIGPPTEIEKSHHVLWRFSEPLPARGGMTIFDRSWYGRVLVERVDELIDHDTVLRSTGEIVEFERALFWDHTIIVKFFLDISAEEQLKRFNERQSDPLKNWKLTPDDWHNREKRPAYLEAINEMIETTDHEHCHWHVVPAEDKHYARVFILESLNKSIEKALGHLGYEVPKSEGRDYRDN